MITAAYVPLPTYHNLFPDAATATELLRPMHRWSTEWPLLTPLRLDPYTCPTTPSQMNRGSPIMEGHLTYEVRFHSWTVFSLYFSRGVDLQLESPSLRFAKLQTSSQLHVQWSIDKWKPVTPSPFLDEVLTPENRFWRKILAYFERYLSIFLFVDFSCKVSSAVWSSSQSLHRSSSFHDRTLCWWTTVHFPLFLHFFLSNKRQPVHFFFLFWSLVSGLAF